MVIVPRISPLVVVPVSVSIPRANMDSFIKQPENMAAYIGIYPNRYVHPTIWSIQSQFLRFLPWVRFLTSLSPKSLPYFSVTNREPITNKEDHEHVYLHTSEFCTMPDVNQFVMGQVIYDDNYNSFTQCGSPIISVNLTYSTINPFLISF